jgi:hypothetical protein
VKSPVVGCEAGRKIFITAKSFGNSLNASPLGIYGEQIQIPDKQGAIAFGNRRRHDVTLRGGDIDHYVDVAARIDRQHLTMIRPYDVKKTAVHRSEQAVKGLVRLKVVRARIRRRICSHKRA